jgi:4-amino-4-deoxy-L-arabinose transferase-like glycosyltransferase
LLLFAGLALHQPTGSDARYVEAAREMLESRDFVIPHLAHVPYFEKPILTYWLAAAAQALFGTSPLAARLPSILAAAGSVVTTYWIGRELRGSRFGVAGACVFATFAITPMTASVLLTDEPLALFHAVATLAYLRHERAPRSAWIWIAWTALGLGVLTKGPVALVLAGTSLAAWLAAAGRLGELRRLRPVLGLALIAAINVPWWWLVGRRDPRFVDFFFIRLNLGSFFHGGVNHAQGPWYYFATLPPALFPWTLIACAAIARCTRRDLLPAARAVVTRGSPPPADRVRLFLVCMVVPPLVFLTVSASKLWYYALPLCPAIALLVADYVMERAAAPGRFLRSSLFVTAGIVAAALAAAWTFAGPAAHERLRFDRTSSLAAGAIVAGMLASLVIGGVLVRRGRVARGFAVAAVGTTVLLLPAYFVAGHATSDADASVVAARVAQAQAPGDQVLVSDRFVQDFTVQLAVKRRVGIVGRARELGVGLFAEVTPSSRPFPDAPHEIDAQSLPENPWLYDMRRLAREWRGPRRIWLIWSAEDAELARLRNVGIEPIEFERDGNVVALTNR